MRCFLLGLAIAVGVAAAAAAAPVRVPLPVDFDGSRTTYSPTIGPYLAGDDVVFGIRAAGTTPARVFAAPTNGGAPRVLPGPTTMIDAGATGLVARATLTTGGGSDRYDPVYTASETLVAGPADGPPATLTTCIAPARVDGARVAYVSGDGCRQLVVRDLVADREVARFVIPATQQEFPLQLAGDHVAWQLGSDVTVGDLGTGATRDEQRPAETSAWTLAPDGALAFVRNTGFQADWRGRVVLRAPGGADREVWSSSAWGSTVRVLGFAGGDPVIRASQMALAWRMQPGDARVFVLRPDGSTRTLLRTQVPSSHGEPVTPGQPLLGVDVEGGRIAWLLGDCDDVAVSSAAIADLPADGVDATAPQHCPRPALERRTVALDRHGRGTVAIRCAQACTGTLTATGVVESDDLEFGQEYRQMARRAFAFGPGRHRIAVRVAAADRSWVAHGRGRRRQVTLDLVGTTGDRASSLRATVTLVALRR